MSRLSTYLNDHLAGSTVAVELARRSARSNRGTAYGDALTRLSAEIAEDRDQLQRIMDELGVRRDPAKVALAWSGEKLGRLKLNGRLIGYSPLSRLEELEILAIGVTGKLLLWEALDSHLAEDGRLAGFDLSALKQRARKQLSLLEHQRLDAAGEAFGSAP